MSGDNHVNGHMPAKRSRREGNGQTISISVVLTGEQAAAVEGWRLANRIETQPEAVRELVRLGLLSEIGRIYRMIAVGRDCEEPMMDGSDAAG